MPAIRAGMTRSAFSCSAGEGKLCGEYFFTAPIFKESAEFAEIEEFLIKNSLLRSRASKDVHAVLLHRKNLIH
jgi:hypothetical protein